MNFALKMLSAEAVPRALEKAERYRLLNDPGEAESICLDALRADPHNQDAVVTLILALTEQFDADADGIVRDALRWAGQIRGEYDRAYYTGIVCERRAKLQLRLRAPRYGARAYQGLTEAMAWYEKAEAIRAPGNDDALLRWNACARMIMRDSQLAPAAEEREEPRLSE